MSVSAVKNSAVSSIAVAALLLLDERCDATVCLSPKPAHVGAGEQQAIGTVDADRMHAADSHQVSPRPARPPCKPH